MVSDGITYSVPNVIPRFNAHNTVPTPQNCLIMYRRAADSDECPPYKYHDVKHNNTTFVSIHHPSYIYVYRRNEIGHYIDSISHIIVS